MKDPVIHQQLDLFCKGRIPATAVSDLATSLHASNRGTPASDILISQHIQNAERNIHRKMRHCSTGSDYILPFDLKVRMLDEFETKTEATMQILKLFYCDEQHRPGSTIVVPYCKHPGMIDYGYIFASTTLGELDHGEGITF